MSEEDREIIDKAREIILKHRDVPGGIEVIKETMNAIFRYYKQVIPEATFDDKRLLEVFKLESLMKNIFLPLNSEPIFDIDNPPVVPDSISNEDDCKKMVEYIVYKTRSKLNEKDDIKIESLSGRCIDSSYYVKKICEELGINQKRFQCAEDLSCDIFHCFNVVNFELPGRGMKTYLVDCSYRQFFTYAFNFLERIGMPLNAGADMGSFMMMDTTRKTMAEELLTKGYIEFIPQNIKNYFDGFVFAGRNGLYYEQLGKSVLEKSDYEPNYTYLDYLNALEHGGLKNEPYIGRQEGVLSRPIIFDNGNLNNSVNININNK